MSATKFTSQGDAPAVRGESRWLTELVGMDGEPRTATTRGKLAEMNFRAWADDIIRRVPQAEIEAREAAFEAYLSRLAETRSLTQAQEAERDAIDRHRRQKEADARQASREAESGETTLRVFEDLGPVWTRRWLADEIAPHVPEIVHAELSTALTCKALRRGLEAVQERRRSNRTVRDPAALIVEVATRWQRSKPTFRMPVEQALKLPVERLAPSR